MCRLVCMHRLLSPEFRPDPEIERTFRILRRNREVNTQVGVNLAEEEGFHNSDPEEEMAEPKEVPISRPDVIGIANNKTRNIQDYAVFDPNAMNTGIVRPEITAAQFEFKPMMFQMLQNIGQFFGAATDDPHLHLKQFLEVASNFKIPGITDDAFRLRLFPYFLRDRAKGWFNSLEPNSIDTWNALAENFIAKYFPHVKNAKMRNEITSFRQGEDESLFDAWERYKEMLRQCPHHGILFCIQLETFYNGLTPSSRNMLDASSGGALLSKSYTEGFDLIESITANTYQWPTIRANPASNTSKKPVGVHEVCETTTLAAQIALIHNMMKTLLTSPALPTVTAEPVNVVSDSAEVACVYCGGAHLYEEYPANPVSTNYVNNFNKNNNPYSERYNPGWRNHPNFSWANAQNQQKAPDVPPGFSAQNNSQLDAILKSFMQETKNFTAEAKNQILSQRVSIKNLENQVGQIATALTQRTSGSLPSTTEAPASTSKDRGKET
ncbi:hypothetical protein QL285_009271 [Trifolium repens]|nr:hypothetical protein QL285_009271 [Trifolium repens]